MKSFFFINEFLASRSPDAAPVLGKARVPFRGTPGFNKKGYHSHRGMKFITAIFAPNNIQSALIFGEYTLTFGSFLKDPQSDEHLYQVVGVYSVQKENKTDYCIAYVEWHRSPQEDTLPESLLLPLYHLSNHTPKWMTLNKLKEMVCGLYVVKITS